MVLNNGLCLAVRHNCRNVLVQAYRSDSTAFPFLAVQIIDFRRNMDQSAGKKNETQRGLPERKVEVPKIYTRNRRDVES